MEFITVECDNFRVNRKIYTTILSSFGHEEIFKARLYIGELFSIDVIVNVCDFSIPKYSPPALRGKAFDRPLGHWVRSPGRTVPPKRMIDKLSGQ